MDKRKMLVNLINIGVIIGIMAIFFLSFYLWKLYQSGKNKTEAVKVSTAYVESFGTYDSQKDISEYLASFKPYLTPDRYNQVASAYNDPNADKETRDYEKSVNYKIKTTVNSAKVLAISRDYKTAQVTLSVQVQTTAKDNTGGINTDSRTLNLVKQNGKWFVESSNSGQ